MTMDPSCERGRASAPGGPVRWCAAAVAISVVCACGSGEGTQQPEHPAGTGGASGASAVATSTAQSSSSSAQSSSSSGSGGAHSCTVGKPKDGLTAATKQGLVAGIKENGALAFLGIPFAAPPVGERRFRAPEAPDCWEGTRDATQFASACKQLLPSGGTLGDEDCLYLNVFTPSKDGPARPVLVFVHGGAYLFGSGSQDLMLEGTGNLYDGKKLALENDAVVVTINYRLAQLGFMAHPKLADEDPSGSSGNYGLLDQIAALRWVKDNIESFGGDPARVMLFGESAGGLSTCLLLASPLAKGLFASALIESGGCIAAPRGAREAQGSKIADAIGCDDPSEVVSCLRDKPASAFLVPPPAGLERFLFEDIQRAWEMPFGPNVDGHVLDEAPLVAIRKAKHGSIPVAVGSNAAEFALFVPPGTVNTCAAYWSLIGTMFDDHASEVIDRYSCFDYVTPRRAAIAVGTDFMFTCPARRIARAALAGGSDVYRYHFRREYSGHALSIMGAFHAAELPFVFGTFGVIGYEPTAKDVFLSSAMGGYWTRFAAAGTPNESGVFKWPAYTLAAEPVLVLDGELSTDEKLASARCDFWDSLASD